MLELFNVSNVAINILGYPMSYVEIAGTAFNLASVWLVARNNILTWPVGIIGVVLFGVLFLQINLYADFFEQIYYLITGFWGWYMWSRRDHVGREIPITKLSLNTAMNIVVGLVVVTLVLGFLMSNIHQYLPGLFAITASYPYLDSLTTVLSFGATILMIRRKIESWYLWIVVDVIGIGLYWSKDVVMLSLLYGIFLIIAISGLINWRSQATKSEVLKERLV